MAGKRGKKSVGRKRAKRSNRKSKAGLNKLEKKQVKAIVRSRKEDKYCNGWYIYDVVGQTGGFIQSALTNPQTLPNVYDNNEDAFSCLVLQTGRYLNSVSDQVNNPLGGVATGTVYPMGGYGMIRGDSAQNIDGDFAYLQSAKISLSISANMLTDDAYQSGMGPLNFRVLVVRAKRSQSGISPSLTTGLYINEVNSRVGLTATASVKSMSRDLRLNTSQFTKVHDITFQLNSPIDPDLAIATTQVSQGMPRNANLPYEKHLNLWMPRTKKKIRFSQRDDGSQNYYEPLNFDFVTYTIITAYRSPPFITVPVGTPLELQQCDSTKWTVRASGMTKYKEC